MRLALSANTATLMKSADAGRTCRMAYSCWAGPPGQLCTWYAIRRDIAVSLAFHQTTSFDRRIDLMNRGFSFPGLTI
jgi:hypothetical protein